MKTKKNISSSKSDELESKSLGSENENKKPSGIPRWLKIATVAIPLAATICAGIWTLSSVFMNQYTELQKSIEKERTQQATTRESEAEKNKQAAQLKLDTEKEATIRFQLQQRAQADAEKDEITLQKLKTEEQQARQAMLEKDINRQLEDLRVKEQTDKNTMQVQEDRDFAALITSVLSPAGKSEQMSSEAALATLMRYVSHSRYHGVIVAALATKTGRIKSLEEAQAWLRLTQAIQPTDFKLVASMNRLARRRVEDGAVQDFWIRYIPQAEEMPAHIFLEEQSLHSDAYASSSLLYNRIMLDIRQKFSDPFRRQLDRDSVLKKISEIQKTLGPSDSAGFEAYLFLMEQSGEKISEYNETHRDDPIKLDISGCYLRRSPSIDPQRHRVNLIYKNVFISER
jgi:hypothetical protein